MFYFPLLQFIFMISFIYSFILDIFLFVFSYKRKESKNLCHAREKDYPFSLP